MTFIFYSDWIFTKIKTPEEKQISFAWEEHIGNKLVLQKVSICVQNGPLFFIAEVKKKFFFAMCVVFFSSFLTIFSILVLIVRPVGWLLNFSLRVLAITFRHQSRNFKSINPEKARKQYTFFHVAFKTNWIIYNNNWQKIETSIDLMFNDFFDSYKVTNQQSLAVQRQLNFR